MRNLAILSCIEEWIFNILRGTANEPKLAYTYVLGTQIIIGCWIDDKSCHIQL